MVSNKDKTGLELVPDEFESVVVPEDPPVPDEVDVESPQADEGVSEEAMVVYTGKAVERTITTSDWASVGAEGQEDSVWNIQNDKRIPASKFNAAALRYLTQVDSGFRVE